jgi:hypothetical protein
MKNTTSLNRIVIILFVLGYVLVNVRMEVAFFSGQDIFSKYQVATSPADALRIAQDAYFAKTAFLLILLALLTATVPFGLAAGLSFVAYAIMMLVFFGFNITTTAYAVGALIVLASYFVEWPWRAGAGRPKQA